MIFCFGNPKVKAICRWKLHINWRGGTILRPRSKSKHWGTKFTQLCNNQPLGGDAYGSLILCQEAKFLHGEFVEMHCQLKNDLLLTVLQLMEAVIYVGTKLNLFVTYFLTALICWMCYLKFLLAAYCLLLILEGDARNVYNNIESAEHDLSYNGSILRDIVLNAS